MIDADLQRLLSASKMRLRSRHLYFTVLAGYLKPTQVSGDSSIKTIATDGRRLLICPEFFRSLSSEDRDFIILHEVLHAAMGHCGRIGPRDPFRWNVAADYVVNLVLVDSGLKMPDGGLLDRGYAGMTTEEVYALLPTCPCQVLAFGEDVLGDKDGDRSKDDAYWKGARAAAEAVARSQGGGALLDKLKVQVERSDLDWRKVLWDSLAYSSSDFGAWDRRLMHDGTYVEDLEPSEEHRLSCAVFVDTSGSMLDMLGRVVGEVEQIQSLYEQLDVDAYFADAEVFGPVPLSNVRKPRGGGSTSFVPAFRLADEKGYERVLYLTDLVGDFPDWVPDADVVWAVPAGCGIVPPFGRVVKIL